MKFQDDPITDDEWVLRRVHRKEFVNLEPPEIQLYAFKPTVKGDFVDETGISFYRQACITAIDDALAKVAKEKKCRYGVVALQVGYLRSIGLHLIRDDDQVVPIVLGHVVMPGINSGNYSSSKDSVLAKMKQLSDYVNSQRSFLILPTAEIE